MSIPYTESPFKRYMLPCKHCTEIEGKIICIDKQAICEHPNICHNYIGYTLREYRDNTSKSLKPCWTTREYDTYTVEECSSCRCRVPRNQWNQSYYSEYCPQCGKKLYLSDEEVKDITPGIYQHFKGKQYKVLEVAEHTETSEKLVIYQALYEPYTIYARPLKMFVEDVEDISNRYRGPRFFKVETK